VELAGIGSSGASAEGELPIDDLTLALDDSFTPTPREKSSVTRPIIPGLLTQTLETGARSPHGVPSILEDYSSWGNEALWQWQW
jgi:hypothetical protein